MATVRDFFHGFIHRGTTFMYLQFSRPLIYHLLSNVCKASYTISASIFVYVPYRPPYSTDKFISCIVLGPSQWFFQFWRRDLNIRLISGEYGGCSRMSHFQRRKRSLTAAAVWLLVLSWRMMGFCTTNCRHMFHAVSENILVYSCVLRSRATSILIQEHCSSFVQMVLGRSHCLYESQRSTHCSRLSEYCRRWLH